MPNIFEIGDKLKAIFTELEENGGELTEELAAELEITKDNFEEKIESYCQVLTMYKSDSECCKNEKARLDAIKKVKDNTIDRIKAKLLEAVKLYGETGKSGNKVITLSTRKLFTKSIESFEEDETRKNKLSYYVLNYLNELSKEGILELGEGVDVNGLLSSINAIAKSEYEIPNEFGNTPVEEFIPYTIADLQSVNLEIKESVSLYNMITKDSKLGYLVASDEIHPLSSSVDKDVAKAIIKESLINDEAIRLTIGNLSNKDSLIIK